MPCIKCTYISMVSYIPCVSLISKCPYYLDLSHKVSCASKVASAKAHAKVSLESRTMQNNYTPGEYNHRWKRTGEVPQHPIKPYTMVSIASPQTAMDELRDMIDAMDQPRRDTQETYVMPVVEKKPIAPQIICPPPYIEYRSVDNPLTMLFGAIVAFAQRFERLPDMLFVSPLLIPILEFQTKLITGKEYEGRFYLFSTKAIDGRTKGFPIMPERTLPDVLRLALGGSGSIGRDSVIAASER